MLGGEILVGVISDTHGLLRPEAVAALRGTDLIIHAGDVGAPEVIDALRNLAPTFVVRGNVESLEGFSPVTGYPYRLAKVRRVEERWGGHVLED